MAATFFVIGINNETLRDINSLTLSPFFVTDEEVLLIGAAFHEAVAMSHLGSQLASLH